MTDTTPPIADAMTDPTARDLIQRLADSVELLLLMRNGLTPLVITEAALDEARAYLAQPEPEVPTDEERFEHWWYHEGSAPPRAEDDSEEHTHRTSKIAWLNGACCARYGNRTPAPIPLSERQVRQGLSHRNVCPGDPALASPPPPRADS